MKKLLATLITSLLITSCAVKVPEDLTPVTNFDAEKYLGTWYEIARIENRFEEGLTNVSAEYSLNKNGSIKVVNRGFEAEKKQLEREYR